MADTGENGLYPAYIPRDEEDEILAEVERVRETGRSRAVLLYGAGGVGKTLLVRTLADRGSTAGNATWLQPIDVDDSEYWLLTNLQANVARQLDSVDPTRECFGRYIEYLVRPPKQSHEHVTAETVVSHLGRARSIFLECYADYVNGTGKPVVIVFDTVEAIRGMGLLVTLTQWMTSLPQTLFILSGRPIPDGGREQPTDPIEEELSDPHQPMPVAIVPLGGFGWSAAEQYLAQSGIAAGLVGDEQAKLVLLTRGHPLWLALTVAYLDDRGMPEEAETELGVIKQNVPFRSDMTAQGQQLHEAFQRRLLSPYGDTDFWHDAVMRLAAVRQGVNEPIWRQLMADRPFPGGATGAAQAWNRLLMTPWIRPRANRRYVTLHDAMAEELARCVIPVHDEDQQWRRDLWERAVEIYGAQTEDEEQRLTADSRKLDSRRQLAGGTGQPPAASVVPVGEPAPMVREATRLGAGKREIDQLKVSRFYYQLLCDFTVGCQYFLELFEQARRDQDLLFQDLLATAMLRCLSAGDRTAIPGDVASDVIQHFGRWLAIGQQALHREIGVTLGDFLVASGQASRAVDLLRELPLDGADARLISRQKILLGNAYLRIPGDVKKGLSYLLEALSVSDDPLLEPAERSRLAAAAYKELGFYYRSVGLWHDADEAYEHARDAIEFTLRAGATARDRSEMASIQSNWAYLKGLNGFHRDGLGLVESAIWVRDELGERLALGISYSVKGEVHRYEQQFKKAWDAYASAAQIFDEAQDQSWLGTVYQQQAICLFQAYHDGTQLVAGDTLAEAWKLAHRAVDICRERAVRSYPSALNRAARILGDQDADAGLGLLEEGIVQAKNMSDGWFWLANLVEHAELSYRAWTTTRQARYRDGIARFESHIDQAMSEYEFPDLRGRWEIVAGHLRVHDWVETGDDAQLDLAQRYYTDGFRHIAERGHVGSSGTLAIPGAFATFRDLFRGLPRNVQAEWLDHLRRAWSGSQPGSTMLLALLERLY